MQITLTKEQVREAFRELRYVGADYCYKYDKGNPEENRGSGSIETSPRKHETWKQRRYPSGSNRTSKGGSLTVVELEEAVYAPYVQRGFPVLVDRISCKGIRVVTGKGNV